MKKFNLLSLAVVGMMALCVFGCQKKEAATTADTKQDEISATTKSQISSLGFSTENARKVEGGYLVEGDILLSEANLTEKAETTHLSVASTEQYRTTNLVKALPRVITISVTNLPTVYSDAVNGMITRYNNLGLRFTFQRAAAGTTGQINVIGFNEGPSGGFITLGSSGFPTAAGNPYSEIKMNTNPAAYGANPNLLYLTSVLQHEVGHCLGFRHTDYSNRAYSCGASGAGNEGQSGVGAILIPGTPSAPDAASFMLACSNGGDRTFNANDIKAINYLYK
ncbi:M57 family metalloprotease [Pedobacter cryoconitis]|uniref:Dual-action HEIGH metallo-peptidase n=1 Tax=Pedobacter cryoconitis TaxID=188932 RepID=A0A327SXY0_9SPHI|nr:M57 family metalloprotease [Pedobacter cryoconitis]RAJ34236.1 dual-action HEIGH metallo-peptidase [Pedobacter cryoconitis]